MQRGKLGYSILKFFLENEYKPITYTELVLRLQEEFGLTATAPAIHIQLKNLCEMDLLKKEAYGYTLTFKILRNCYEQYETKRKDFFLKDRL